MGCCHSQPAARTTTPLSSMVADIPLFLHSEPVFGCCLLGNDPNFLLSASEDQTAQLFDLAHGRIVASFEGHLKSINQIAYCPRNRLLATASRDCTVKLWKAPWPSHTDNDDALAAPVLVAPGRTLDGHRLSVTTVDIAPDGRYCCSGGRDTALHIWDNETATSLACQRLSQNLVTGVKYFPAGDTVLQASEDLKLRLWDARSLTLIQAVAASTQIALALDIDASGNRILAAFKGYDGDGCELKVWLLVASSFRRMFSVCWMRIFKGYDGDGCELKLWDRRFMDRPQVKFCGHTQAVGACAFLARGEMPYVVSGSNDRRLMVWSIDTGECVLSKELPAAVTCLSSTAGGRIFFREGVLFKELPAAVTCLSSTAGGRWEVGELYECGSELTDEFDEVFGYFVSNQP
ncbi:putative Wdr31 protein [Paratrimastix pyriformis]|uniref:Wdr31 protein n=1 Tax=Paratrimastix pyriformis TaxID=342808 RepID=A0ABQ8U7Z1_9EUKA|nr:putative Wdr31 protein [Paratrimastix pyriformis]